MYKNVKCISIIIGYNGTCIDMHVLTSDCHLVELACIKHVLRFMTFNMCDPNSRFFQRPYIRLPAADKLRFYYTSFGNKAVSEIKLLFCARAGCTSHKTVHPEIAPCTLPIYSNNKWLKKRAHTGCTPPKIVHPAVEMCTPGAGCTLNFGHCKASLKKLVLKNG